MTAIDFQTDPATARRYRVVSLVTHADISDIVWADDETGCYAVRGRDPKPTKPEPNRDFELTPPSAVRAIFG